MSGIIQVSKKVAQSSFLRKERNKCEQLREREIKESQEGSQYFQEAMKNREEVVKKQHFVNLLQQELTVKSDAVDEEYAVLEGAFAQENSARFIACEVVGLSKLLGLDKKIDKIYEKINLSDEDSALALLGGELGQLQKGEAYLVIVLILERLRQDDLKKKFFKELQGRLSEFELQESAYLFQFLKTIKDTALCKENGITKVSGMVDLATGSMSFSGIRQAIEFVSKYCDNNYDHLVSVYMKVCGRQLDLLDENAESRTKFLALMQIEYYFILVNSLVDILKELRTGLVKNKLDMNQNNSDSLLQLLNFFESPFISIHNLNVLLNGWKLIKMNAKEMVVLINHVLRMSREIPPRVFLTGQANKQRVIDGLCKLSEQLSSHENDLTNGTVPAYLRIKSRNKKAVVA